MDSQKFGRKKNNEWKTEKKSASMGQIKNIDEYYSSNQKKNKKRKETKRIENRKRKKEKKIRFRVKLISSINSIKNRPA